MQTNLGTITDDPNRFSPVLPTYTKEKMWESIRLSASISHSYASQTLLILADSYDRIKEATGLDLEPTREISLTHLAEAEAGKIVNNMA